MNVPDCHGRQRQRWRPPLAALLMLALTTLTGAAPAVVFDEKVKAPMMKNAAELRTQAQGFAARYLAVRESAPEQLIRNAALAREKFDVQWQIQRAIDERKPLGEFESLGLAARADGGVEINLDEHPEWRDLHQHIAGMLAPANFDVTLPGLINRGFRPEDIVVLREYVAAHDAQSASAAATLPIALGFGRAVRKYDQVKRPVPDALVHSFWYQRARAAGESDRAWVDGLLKRFDAQRGRVLLSYFLESKGTAFWIPEDVDQGIAELLVQVRRPDFEAVVTAEAKGVAP